MSAAEPGHRLWCCPCACWVSDDRAEWEAHGETAEHRAAFRVWAHVSEPERVRSTELPEDRCGACQVDVQDWWTHRRTPEHCGAVARYLAAHPIPAVLEREIRMSLRERPPLHQTCQCGECECCEIEDRLAPPEQLAMFRHREGA